MYFNKENKFNLNNHLSNEYKFYAHKSKDRMEALEEHLNLSEENLYRLFKTKSLDIAFKNIENIILKNLDGEDIDLFRKMILDTVYIHDIGKINPVFQLKKMDNDLGLNEAIVSNNSNHSIISSIIYLNYYFKIIKGFDKEKMMIFINIALMNGYIISKHHGNLDSFEEFKNKLTIGDGEGKKLFDNNFNIIKDVYKDKIELNINIIKQLFKINEKYISTIDEEAKISSFIYEKLMFSLLLACDYYSTTEFMTNSKIENLGEFKEVDEFYKVYKDTNITKSIRAYEKNEYKKPKNFSSIKDINILRNEMFLMSEESLKNNLDKNIFYLEAPTGGGKSNIAMNLSFKIIEEDKNINKIVYVYPFNTLIEQNINSINKTFENSKDLINKVSVINSLVAIKKSNDKGEEVNYEDALLNRQFLHYPMVLTTHVSLFNYLFSTGKEESFPLVHLANSVIVLDEIQSYKNIIWKEIIMFLEVYSKLLNIKIIIMSATLPNLSSLTDNEINVVRLIKNPENYFKSPVFKGRVELDFSLIESDNVHEDLINHITSISQNENKNILVEFIRKESAYNFYRELKSLEEIESEILLITGDDNQIDRKTVLDKVKEKKGIILVATQVIEAGVDIDMDSGYKDISILDSDEQFLGRINRSCKKECAKVYFFNLDKADLIYQGDIRKNRKYTLLNDEMKEIIRNKEFNSFYKGVLEDINSETSKLNDKNIENFINNIIGKLNFLEIQKKMKLIDDDKLEYTVFLNRTVNKIEGREVWDRYKDLLKDNKIYFAEKKVKLSEINSKLNYFIYKIRGQMSLSYDERIGDIYYIDNGEDFFEDGKLNKSLFSSSGAEIL